MRFSFGMDTGTAALFAHTGKVDPGIREALPSAMGFNE